MTEQEPGHEEPQPEPTPARAGPIPAAERILTLDVLRGLALFGILLINVSALSLPTDWFRVDWDGIGAAEYAVEVGKLIFFQGKFYTLFAFLFGVGFAIQLTRAERKGVGFAARFFWRMLLLYAIGVTHIVVLWDGDILNLYAGVGLLLLLFYGLKRLLDIPVRKLSKKGRKRAPRWVVLVVLGALFAFSQGAPLGFSIYAYQTHQAYLAGETLNDTQQWIIGQLADARSPERAEERAKRKAEGDEIFKNGGYLDTVRYRTDGLWPNLHPNPFWLTLLCIFILGAYVGRQDFIGRAQELRQGFKRLTLYSLAVGVPATAAFVLVTVSGDLEPYPWLQVTQFVTKTVSGLAFALALVGAVTLAMMTGARKWLLHLAPVGQMALTNYLLQSAIGVYVFYGYGLGLMGKLNAVEQVPYCVILFTLQVLFSRWWLSRFRFGPVEWLWRSLTYLRRQPMRRAAAG